LIGSINSVDTIKGIAITVIVNRKLSIMIICGLTYISKPAGINAIVSRLPIARVPSTGISGVAGGRRELPRRKTAGGGREALGGWPSHGPRLNVQEVHCSEKIL
jgi:hypothetical protein